MHKMAGSSRKRKHSRTESIDVGVDAPEVAISETYRDRSFRGGSRGFALRRGRGLGNRFRLLAGDGAGAMDTGESVLVYGLDSNDREETIWRLLRTCAADLRWVSGIELPNTQDSPAVIRFHSSMWAHLFCEYFSSRDIIMGRRKFYFKPGWTSSAGLPPDHTAPGQMPSKDEIIPVYQSDDVNRKKSLPIILKVSGFDDRTTVDEIREELRVLGMDFEVIGLEKSPHAYVRIATIADSIKATELVRNLPKSLKVRNRNQWNLSCSDSRLAEHFSIVGSVEVPKVEEWPQPFEQAGTRFVFDSSTGLYYDERSMFYYNAQQNIYYSCIRQAFYRFDKDSGFVESESPSMNSSDKNDSENQEKGASESGSIKVLLHAPKRKPKSKALTERTDEVSKTFIAIPDRDLGFNRATRGASLDSEGFSGSGGSPCDLEERIPKALVVHEKHKPRPSFSGAKGKQKKDILQWNEARQRMQAEECPFKCYLCRRKFPSQEKLDRHVSLSPMHQENLDKGGKQSAENKSRLVKPTNRIRQRRETFGSGGIQGSSPTVPSVLPPIAPSSKGAALLRTMGWTEGEAIGKASDSGGITDPINAVKIGGKLEAGTTSGLGFNSRRPRLTRRQ